MHRTLHILLVTTVLTSAAFALPVSVSAAFEVEGEEFGHEEFGLSSAPVNELVLDETRGTFTPDLLNLNNAVLNADSSGNSVVGGVTGSNFIDGGSFTNTQGLVNVIQNSGNNVVIQSQTIVNMTMVTN